MSSGAQDVNQFQSQVSRLSSNTLGYFFGQSTFPPVCTFSKSSSALHEWSPGKTALQLLKHAYIGLIYMWSQAQTLIVTPCDIVSIFTLHGLNIWINISWSPSIYIYNVPIMCDVLSQCIYMISMHHMHILIIEKNTYNGSHIPRWFPVTWLLVFTPLCGPLPHAARAGHVINRIWSRRQCVPSEARS